MKKFALLVAVMCLLAFPACEQVGTTSSDGLTSSVATENSMTSGTYKGQKITLSCITVTDRVYYGDVNTFSYFWNGYMVFFDNGTDSDSFDYGNRWSCMDSTGRIMFTKACEYMLPFDENGCSYIMREKDFVYSYAKIDLSGNESPVTQEEYKRAKEKITEIYNQLPWENETKYGTFKEITDEDGTICYMAVRNDGRECGIFYNDREDLRWWAEDIVLVGSPVLPMHIYNTDGEKIMEQSVDKIGNFYNGIAPFWQDHKMGLIGDDGKIIIPATVESETTVTIESPCLEDKIVIEYDGKIAVLQFDRE